MRELICKPLLLLLVVGIAVISFSQPTLSAENEIHPNAVKTESAENEIHPNAVKTLYFNIYESIGKITGYVIFTDKDANQCATRGKLTLRRKYKDELISYDKKGKPIYSYKTELMRHMEFRPEDFKNMGDQDGTEIYALPIYLKTKEASVGDVIIFKWHGFELDKEIWKN